MGRWAVLAGLGWAVCSVGMAFCSGSLAAQEVNQAAPASPNAVQLTPIQLFGFADAARDKQDYTTAEAAYRALTGNTDADIRAEARFRLAMMLAYQCKRPTEAAQLLRQILDEKPRVARVRLELARIDAMLGRVSAAGRELRAAEAAGLPTEVERAVRFYAQALDVRRPVGGSVEVTLAPDSNINRATAAPTLSTVLGNFALSNDAKASSGLGATVRGQGFVRIPTAKGVDLLARVSGSANVYRASEFDDFILAPQIGPEITLGKGKLNLAIGGAWRWYGAVPYSFSWLGSANWQHPLGRKAQLRVDAGFAAIDNRRDALETGDAWSLGIGLDRAFSARLGGGVQVTGLRQTARDPGYATAGGGLNGYVFREIGKTTVTVNAAYNHLEGDARLVLFSDRRIDNLYIAGVSATLRQIRVGSIAPVLRFRFERNASTVQIYDYRRFVGEAGITTAF